MKLDLVALKNRCLRAHRMGWTVAFPSVADLEAELGSKMGPPPGVRAGSPAHLVGLIEAIQAKELLEEMVVWEKVALEPELVEVELFVGPGPEEGVEVELADEPEAEEGEELEVLTYDEMTYQQLIDEARDRGLPGRRGMSKVDLLEMLEETP